MESNKTLEDIFKIKSVLLIILDLLDNKCVSKLHCLSMKTRTYLGLQTEEND